MAIIGLAFSLGFTVGPLLSALGIRWLVDTFKNVTVLGALGMSAIGLNALGLLTLCGFVATSQSENIRPTIRNRESVRTVLRLVNVSSLFSLSGVSRPQKDTESLRTYGLIWFSYVLIFSGLESALIFLTRSRFGYTSRDQGRMFFIIGLWMIAIQGGLIRRFSPGNELRLASTAILILASASAVVGIAQHLWVFHLGLFLWSFAAATFIPTFQAAISFLAGPDRQGHVLGVFRSLNALARAIGPALFSLLFWATGSICSYVIAACPLVLLWLYFRHTNRAFARVHTQ
ncbi:unnamed protein product [Dicrocoelium dendriticum]|nr:unnamed protein product [Dicrocoelium dendriticum]